MLSEMKKLGNRILDYKMLQIKNLYAGYTKEKPILKGIDLTVEQGQVIGILGRNGSGKSTLAKAICGLVPFIEGEILLNGKSIMGLSTNSITLEGLGFFLQGGRIFPNLTVSENLAFAGREPGKTRMEQRINEMSDWFELLQKKERLKLKASYLSGGEKHQLAMAMVLIRKPIFLILDEPSAGLSPGNQAAMYKALGLVRSAEQLTMMVIEQNVELAKEFTDNISKLINGTFTDN